MEKHHGCRSRRGHRNGRQAVAPLYPGAAAARQGGQPARHRLRARRGQPARHAGRGRGCRKRIEALEHRTGDDRARKRDRHRYRHAPRGQRPAGRRAEKPGVGTALERRARSSTDASLRAQSATAPSRSKAPQQAGSAQLPLRRRRRQPVGRAARRPAASSRQAQAKLAKAGRNAADPADRRSTRRCRRAWSRLDRDSGRPDGQERDRDHPEPRRDRWGSASSARSMRWR
jgi:hypothetical protein